MPSMLSACCPPTVHAVRAAGAGALDKMFSLYRRLLPGLGGYLTHAGQLNRGRLEVFLSHLAAEEADVLQARAEVRAETFFRASGRAGRERSWERSCGCAWAAALKALAASAARGGGRGAGVRREGEGNLSLARARARAFPEPRPLLVSFDRAPSAPVGLLGGDFQNKFQKLFWSLLVWQDAEAFEAKRARREGGGAPAWASARVEAKKAAAAAAENELDEDDAFEVGDPAWILLVLVVLVQPAA